jgi:PAS domain S-box-containing protein
MRRDAGAFLGHDRRGRTVKAALSEVRTLLRLSDARQDAILKASLDAIVIMDADGCFTEFNPAAERLFGYARAEVLGKPIADFIIPERLRGGHRAGMARFLTTGVGVVINQRLELPALKASGEEFPVELAIVPVEDQTPPMFVGFIRDITESKQAEQRRQWLLDEFAHRSRNLFTVVQAIIARTLHDARPAAEARTLLSERVNALSRSNAALLDRAKGAALTQIIAQEIAGFSDRVSVSGPEVVLRANAAQAFALIVHELATNASKHGALSHQDGGVALTWIIAEDGQFVLEWREHGGPKIGAPARSGFGSVVLQQMAATELGATVELKYEADGLHYRLSAPVTGVA